MDIAVSTSILCDTGSPETYLRLIAEAGFTHLHWGHHWDTDFLYSSFEIAQCKKWLKTYGLKLLDIHGSEGVEKQWFSPEEYRRRSGVELVLNRVVMLRELEGPGCVMMHLPPNRAIKSTPEDERLLPARVEALKRSLDEIVPALEKYDAKLAVENRRNDSFRVISEVMAAIHLIFRISKCFDLILPFMFIALLCSCYDIQILWMRKVGDERLKAPSTLLFEVISQSGSRFT